MLEHLTHHYQIPDKCMARVLKMSVPAYRELAKGRRRPSAYVTFALMVLMRGRSFKMLMQKQRPSTQRRHNDNVRRQRSLLSLIYRYNPHMHQGLIWTHPLIRAGRELCFLVDWERERPRSPLAPRESLPPILQKKVRYMTGRVDRPYIRLRKPEDLVVDRFMNRRAM